MSLLGAGVGFLWFNAHPAEVFMGDTGSLSLGGAIGLVSMLIKKEILLILIGGVFVAEAMSVIIQVISYKLWGRRVFLMSPLHHHFELKGWSESKIIVRFWIAGAMLALVALSTIKIQ
jgi:phospho-N-acetylmuramoyl-pentapeptide-transferase